MKTDSYVVDATDTSSAASEITDAFLSQTTPAFFDTSSYRAPPEAGEICGNAGPTPVHQLLAI